MLDRFPRFTFVGTVSLLTFVLGLASQVAPTLAWGQQTQDPGSAARPPSRAVASAPTTRPPQPQVTEPAYESEYCEVLSRFNAEKKITDPGNRNRFEGHYNTADDPQRLRTWSVETVCGGFLVAIPLWADVSPAVLESKGGNTFVDSTGTTWEFQVGPDGAVTGAIIKDPAGKSTVQQWGDPHESLNGKHTKDWEGRKQ
jgi:hypothetical protein